MIGLLNYKSEGNPYKLWIPKDSDFVKNTDWLWSHYPPDSRYNMQGRNFTKIIGGAYNLLNLKIGNFIIFYTCLRQKYCGGARAPWALK